MDLYAETSYRTPLSNSPLLPLLILSLAREKRSPTISESFNTEYDYIVVGGGAAGSVVASRISEIPSVNVLLLEAGPEAPILTEVPALGSYFLGTDVDWKFRTVPQKNLARNQQLDWSSGKMLGGSASMNAMIYVRGNRKNYDDWAAQGAKGWSYKDVFPYFLKLEDNTNLDFLLNGYHSVGGPITAEQPYYQPEIRQAAHKVAERLGYEYLDPNAARQTGFYDIQMNMRNGQRCSSVKGYLVPASNRRNLDILVNAPVTKVIIENGQATGVEFSHKGKFQRVRARKEVIVSAGTVNTPKILMLSGIGPREELEKWNISVKVDLPVGRNFHDHGASALFFRLNSKYSIYRKIPDPSVLAEYMAHRSGPLTSFGVAAVAFLDGLNATTSTDSPNYQLFIDESHSDSKTKSLFKKFSEENTEDSEDEALFSCASQHLQPRSRGTVTLSSTNPFDPPLIDPNYLEDEKDLEDIVDGLKMCKKILFSEPFRKLGVEKVITNSPGCEIFKDDNEFFRCHAKHIFTTIYHPVGTSKMGDPADPTTVVDPKLRVKNVKGLRVVDASVMPTVTSGNTHIPTVMIAEKASDMIKESLRSSKKHSSKDNQNSIDKEDRERKKAKLYK